MTNDGPLLPQQLREILEKESLDSLDVFQNSKNWMSLHTEERHLLAQLFVKRGEMELKKGDSRFQESFALADNISPDNANNLYLKGKAFSSFISNARCLTSAVEAFQKAVEIESDFFEALVGWGDALLSMGIFHQQPHHFQEAQQKFLQAFSCMGKQAPEIEARFYWRWGHSWHLMGMNSEEPVDFHQAIQKYRQAQQLGECKADFWQDFAEALVELADLVKQVDLCLEAVDYYHMAVCQDMENYDRWFRLASCHEKLYDVNAQIQHFELAQAAFEVTSKTIEPQFFMWVRWGKLYLNAAKLQKNDEFAATAMEKFAKASEIDSQHPVLLGLWGEAEMIYGMQTEKLELLRSAEQKIMQSIKQIPDNPHIWALYGTCLNELGRYFNDESYYVQAIEKFQHGLSLSENDPLLWYGLAISFFSLGEYWNDSQQIENSVRSYQKVFDFGGQHFSQFWNDWGVALMKLSELTNDKTYLEYAIQKFEHMIKLQDDGTLNKCEAEWLYNYGCALDFFGDFCEDVSYYEKAVVVLTQALQMEPHYTNARYNLAVTLSHFGEAASDLDSLQHSVEHFKILLTQDPEDEMAWNDCGLALLNIAELIHESSRPEKSKYYYDESEQKFLHALALGCTHTYYNLACLHSLLHNYPSALHYLEKADLAGTLPCLDDMLHDEWLENLVETPQFRQFISHISLKNNPIE